MKYTIRKATIKTVSDLISYPTLGGITGSSCLISLAEENAVVVIGGLVDNKIMYLKYPLTFYGSSRLM
jgi:hypothetical protein